MGNWFQVDSLFGRDGEASSSVAGATGQVFGGGIDTASTQGMAVYCFKLFIKARGWMGTSDGRMRCF